MTTAGPGLQLHSVSAGYGPIRVVEGLNLTVATGEIVAMLGPNGAGKSTTLMTIAGVLPVQAGHITLNDVEVTGPAHRRCRSNFAFVPEGRSVFPSLTVEQNLDVAGVDTADAMEMFPELKKRSRLRAGLLSGGEQQMLALSRAIGRNPTVLLLDEVSFGLAPIACERIYERLAHIVAERQVSVLLVEQHLELAARTAHRAYVMVNGEVQIQLGTDELLQREKELTDVYFGTV